MRRALLALLLLLLFLALGYGGRKAIRAGMGTPAGWIRVALVAIADAWLVPDVDIDGITLVDASTVRLEGLRLHADGVEVLHCEGVVVAFGQLPERGKPLRIARIELDRPVLTLKRRPGMAGWRPIGFDPLLEARLLQAPDSLAPELRPSEVLDLRLLQIRDGVLVFDDGASPPLRLDGISMDLAASPAIGPEGQEGHRAAFSLGQPPGLSLKAGGWFDLDEQVLSLDEASITLDLSDAAAVARLTPGAREAAERLGLRGQLQSQLTGHLELKAFERSSLQLDALVTGLRVELGDLRLPIDAGALKARLHEGRVTLSEARLQLPGGSARLSQGEVAIEGREFALAADWALDQLPLHELIAGGSLNTSVATGSGRVFVSSQDAAVGLTVQGLAVGPPGEAPALQLARGQVSNARLGLSPHPLKIGEVALQGLILDLVPSHGGLRGIPSPRPDPRVSVPDPTAASAPAWMRLLQVQRVLVEGSTLRLPVGGGSFGLVGLGVELTGFGVEEQPTFSASLNPGGGTRGSASGRLDPTRLRLHLDRIGVAGPLGSAGLSGLFPPGTRELVASLLPAGDLSVEGSGAVGLNGGGLALGLDARIRGGRARLVGLNLPVDSGKARFDLAGGDLAFAGVHLEGAQGSLDLPALALDAGGRLTGAWVASGLDLKQLRSDGGTALGEGRLSSSGKLAGTVSGGDLQGLSVVDASLTVEGGPRGQMRWTAINLNLAAAPGGQRLDLRVAGPGGGQLDLSGSLPPERALLRVDSLSLRAAAAGEGAAILPLGLRSTLGALSAGALRARASGGLHLSDPVGASTLSGVVELEDGAMTWGDWRIGAVGATLPWKLSGGEIRVNEGRVDVLGSSISLPSARWSLVQDRGALEWEAADLRLDQLQPAGGSARAIGGLLQGQGTVDLGMDEDGLLVREGAGRVQVSQGRLLPLPLFSALSEKAGGDRGAGDDALELRFALSPRALQIAALDLDLGPVRYHGVGEIRYSGGLDLDFDARRDHKGVADLAARLVAWTVGGSLDAPRVQARPMGVDTRTFSQKGDPGDAMDDLSDERLDELATPADRAPAARKRPDLDIDLDDFDGFQ